MKHSVPDTTYLKFPDGSQLKLEVEANVPDDVHGEGEAMDIAWAQSAGKWYGKIIEKLYADATEKHIDFVCPGMRAWVTKSN